MRVLQCIAELQISPFLPIQQITEEIWIGSIIGLLVGWLVGLLHYWCYSGLSLTKETYLGHIRDIFGTWHILDISWTYLGYIWDVSWTYLGHTWDISGTYLGYIWDVSWTYLGNILDISGAYLKYIYKISGTHLGHNWDISGIYPGPEMSPKLKCHQKWNFHKNKIVIKTSI